MRFFEEILIPFKKIYEPTTLPIRADLGSAGYDFYSKETVGLQPGESHTFITDVKAYMQKDEVLLVFIRSSLGINYGLNLKNGTGVIDSTYYGNPKNDGNILIPIINNGDGIVTINAGDRIAQGIFMKYLIVDDDVPLHKTRTGGVGSSNR